MKSRYKAILLGALSIFAVACAVLSTVSYVSAEKGEAAEAVTASTEGKYVLKEHNGYVAVYMENDMENPVTVTDIQVSTLRELDRKLMETGIKIATRDRLMMTLEDLGS